jgi:MFS family permease
VRKTSAALLSRLFASSPLRHASFRLFYFGSIGVALGYTMQATIAAWLMATLTPSALMVALVQTASTAPTLLFGLIAGALADIADRRKIILMTQIVLFAAALILGGATVAGTGPAALLALTRSDRPAHVPSSAQQAASMSWCRERSCRAPSR